MVMKWFTVEHSQFPVDFGGEYLIRQPPSRCCGHIERSIYRHSTRVRSLLSVKNVTYLKLSQVVFSVVPAYPMCRL